MLRSRLSAAIYLALVFASGVLVGGFANRLYMNTRSVSAAPRTTPDEWRKRYVNDIREKVKLDEQQIQQLQQILDSTRQRYHQLREVEKNQAQAIQADQTTQIRAMLRDDQKPLYENWRAERERRRQELEKKKGNSSGGPPRH
jgi:hypothetical protein